MSFLNPEEDELLPQDDNIPAMMPAVAQPEPQKPKTPTISPEFSAAMEKVRQTLGEQPQRKPVSGWQRLAAGLVGAGAGLVNASGRTHIDPRTTQAAVEGVSGEAAFQRQNDDWRRRVDAVGRQAQIEGEKVKAQQGMEDFSTDQAYKQAQIGHLQGEEARARRQAALPPPPDPIDSIAPGHWGRNRRTGEIIQGPPVESKPDDVAPGHGRYNKETGKWEIPVPANPSAEKENPNQWIADQNNPDPAISGPARKKLADYRVLHPEGGAGGGLAGGGGAPVTPEADTRLRKEAADNPSLDYDAWTYMLERKLNVRGIGKQASAGAEKIKQRAGQIMKDLQIGPDELYARSGELKGNLGAYSKISTTSAQIASFENTLQRNAKVAQKLSDAYARGDLRMYNRVVAAFKTGTGDPEALNLAAQLHGLAREWGKIMAGSVSAAGVPISEANAADEFFGKGISNGQLSSLIENVIIPDAHNRTAANEEEKAKLLGNIRGLAGGPRNSPPPAAAPSPAPTSANPNPNGYAQTATGVNGHKIGSNDGGNTWFDVQTGQPVR